jgi:V/A-type H+-transporting ATPase subunit K
MSMFFLIPLALLVVILAPVIITLRNYSTGKKVGTIKKALTFNLSAFAIVCLVGIVMPIGGLVSAATTASTVAGTSLGAGLGLLAAALSTGLACIAAGIAVANGAAAAIGAISEEPKIFGRAMIFVVLGEGIAIYGMVISIMIIGAIH